MKVQVSSIDLEESGGRGFVVGDQTTIAEIYEELKRRMPSFTVTSFAVEYIDVLGEKLKAVK
jgi:hypothetical protein